MLRLRQICLVAQDRDAAAAQFTDVLGIDIAFHDPHIERLGLHNTLMPIGTQLVEIVSPIVADTTAERYLQRRGGDGGYMVITQTDDHSARRARVDELGVRIVAEYNDTGFTNMQLHPRDTGGSFLEIDHQEGGEDPMGAWNPAGPDWQQAIRTELVDAITGVEVQCDDPADVATRWSRILQVDLGADGDLSSLALDNATVRFVPVTDGRGEGLGGIDLACSDPERVRANAEAAGVPVAEDHVVLGGLRCYLR